MIVVGRESEGITRAYLADYKLEVDQVAVASAELKFRATPTLVVVDRSGKVQRLWRGLMTPSQQDEVFQLLASESSAAN